MREQINCEPIVWEKYYVSYDNEIYFSSIEEYVWRIKLERLFQDSEWGICNYPYWKPVNTTTEDTEVEKKIEYISPDDMHNFVLKVDKINEIIDYINNQ